MPPSPGKRTPAANIPVAPLSRRLLARLMRGIPPAPGSLLFRLFDRFYTERTWPADPEGFAESAERIVKMSAPSGDGRPGRAGQALVLLLRGQNTGHNLHNILVGRALLELGYSVRYVVCAGQVESCGAGQLGAPLHHPPLLCRRCRSILDLLDANQFPRLSLNDYDSQGARATAGPRDRIDPQRSNGATSPADAEAGEEAKRERRLFDLIRPFLMRFFHGDVRRLERGNKHVKRHVAAGVRYRQRFAALLDQERPDLVCLFNGLFFPESILMEELRARGVPALTVERGMSRNTLFLAWNEPACLYRSHAYWAHVRARIGTAEVGQTQNYLEGRLSGPEDPTGRVRVVPADTLERLREHVGNDPFVLLFAPVLHDTAAMGESPIAGGFVGLLESIVGAARRLRKRLVVRAHPDEFHANNPSYYGVAQIMQDRALLGGGISCLDSSLSLSAYDIASVARATVIYNGSLGIELPALGHPVYNVCRSHYAGKGFTIDIESEADLARVFDEPQPTLDDHARQEALRYLYYYRFVANLSVDALLDEYEPFRFRGTSGPPERAAEQLGQLRGRIRFFLELEQEPARTLPGE